MLMWVGLVLIYGQSELYIYIYMQVVMANIHNVKICLNVFDQFMFIIIYIYIYININGINLNKQKVQLRECHPLARIYVFF